MPRRHRLEVVCYADEHGLTIAGPHPDADRVEAEAWAYLREKLAHMDRAKLRPSRTYHPHGGLVLKVFEASTLLPVGIVHLRALLLQVGPDGRETGRTDQGGPG